MGQAISIESKYCVQVPESLLVKYTVDKSGYHNHHQSGWRIPLQCNVESVNINVPSASKHGLSDYNGLENWRIFMDNGSKNPENYTYGWRRVRTIYPSNLFGNNEAIEKWQEATITLLEKLEAERLEGGGKTPQQEFIDESKSI
jgi:hypothetical protein